MIFDGLIAHLQKSKEPQTIIIGFWVIALGL